MVRRQERREPPARLVLANCFRTKELNMIPPIEWDKFEPFVSTDGIPLVRYAVSDRDGVRFEMSMHDETIRGFVPERLCFQVRSFPTNNVKAEPVAGGGFTALFKVGKPNDEAGNLTFMRATTKPGFSAARYAMVVAITFSLMAELDIRPDKHVMVTIRGN